jgi:hypothetical protein
MSRTTHAAPSNSQASIAFYLRGSEPGPGVLRLIEDFARVALSDSRMSVHR